MGVDEVKEALRSRFQSVDRGEFQVATVGEAPSTPPLPALNNDPLIARASALVELALNGSQDEREFAIQRLRDIAFLAQVLAKLAPGDPRVIALNYVVNATNCKEAAGELVREFLKGASLPKPFDALGKLLG